MSADPEAYHLSQGVWVPAPEPRPAPYWDGVAWVRGLQYTSDDPPETWAAGLDAVLGPEEGEPCRSPRRARPF
jgi:hypothetical protein